MIFDMIDIGMRIRDLRKAKDISGKELSIALGFTQSFLSGIENGNKKCSLETLIAICNELNVSLSDFFSDQVPNLSPSIQQLLNTANKLPANELDALLKLLETRISNGTTQ